MSDWDVTQEEKKYLRDLAKKQLEYSMLPIMKEREERWYKHNDLKGEVPMIHFETWTCEQDLLPPIKCTSNVARGIELQMVREMLNHELIGDDRVVPSYFRVGWSAWMVLFNIHVKTKHAEDSKGGHLGHQFLHPIKDFPEDMKNLEPTVFNVDRDRTMKWKAFLEDLFGDILPVKMGMGSPGASLSQNIVHLMGMEAMIFAMMDHPAEFHDFIGRITKDHVDYFKWMESEGLLFLNNGNNGLAQGTFGFTKDLPKRELASDESVRTQDLWCYMDSQETVSISPDMFREFFFPYYFEVAKQFGLLSYGCCEPVHAIWEQCVSKLPNLRKVSISPWCDEEYMGQALKGSNVIYHRKPSPNFVGVGKELDEDAFREHILKTVECARGCKLEISFRDVYNLEGNKYKPRRAVEIVREVVEEHWS